MLKSRLLVIELMMHLIDTIFMEIISMEQLASLDFLDIFSWKMIMLSIMLNWRPM